MLRKYYSADFVKDGIIQDNFIVRVWFFDSAWVAWDLIDDFAKVRGGKSVNFHRVK